MATLLKNTVTPNIGIAPVTVLKTVSNNRFTIIGLNLANTGNTMVQVSIQVVDNSTYAGNNLAGVAITSTTGDFSCTATYLVVGQAVTITGTNTGGGSISGYVSGTAYYIIATNGTTTFQLSANVGGPPVTTTTGTPTGWQFAAATVPITSYFLKNIMIAPQSSLKAITNSEKLVIAPDNELKISANANNSVDAVVSFVEIL